MYRCFKTKPGDLRNNANVRNMGMKMLEYDMANSKPDGDSNDAGAKENHKLAKQTLELQNYFQENVMKIGRTGVTAERQADRGAKFVRNMMMALIGGNAIIVPMLIMMLHKANCLADDNALCICGGCLSRSVYERGRSNADHLNNRSICCSACGVCWHEHNT